MSKVLINKVKYFRKQKQSTFSWITITYYLATLFLVIFKYAQILAFKANMSVFSHKYEVNIHMRINKVKGITVGTK